LSTLDVVVLFVSKSGMTFFIVALYIQHIDSYQSNPKKTLHRLGLPTLGGYLHKNSPNFPIMFRIPLYCAQGQDKRRYENIGVDKIPFLQFRCCCTIQTKGVIQI
jgi:hypothetical protein